jgi:hypothetical protein
MIAALMLWSIGAPGLASAQENEELYSPFMVAARIAPPSGLTEPLAESRMAFRSLGDTQGERVRAAIGLVKRGEYAYAVEILEPYSATDDFLALHALGVAYVRLARNREAYELLLRAHRLRPAVPGPLLPAALACARMARTCDDYRDLALTYKARGGKFTRFADRIASHLPITLAFPRR